MTAISPPHEAQEKQYRRRIWAWTMYDWANSAFATTILAAVLPIYFSQVAGSTLPSAAVATSYWSFGLSLSLFLIAILAPMCALMIWIGFQPGPFLERMEPSVQAVLERVENAPAPTAMSERVTVVGHVLDEELPEGVAGEVLPTEDDNDEISSGDQE